MLQHFSDYNLNFKKIIENYYPVLNTVSNLDQDYYHRFLNNKIYFNNGFYVLYNEPINANLLRSTKFYNDDSRYEYTSNKIFVNDFLSDSIRDNRLLFIGIDLSIKLRDKLVSTFPSEKFKIIVSYDMINEDGYEDCIITFYKYRENEGDVLLDDLNLYKNSATAIIKT